MVLLNCCVLKLPGHRINKLNSVIHQEIYKKVLTLVTLAYSNFLIRFITVFPALKDFAKPVAWSRPLYELDLENEDNNGFQNEDLIVWMRTAALPTFRKLYRRVDHNQKYFDHGLYQGNYTLHVDYGEFLIFQSLVSLELIYFS